MMDAGGILAGIKNLSPNSTVRSNQNEIEINIPKEDIVNYIKNATPDNIRPYINVEYTETGIKVRVRLM